MAWNDFLHLLYSSNTGGFFKKNSFFCLKINVYNDILLK